MSGPLSLDPLDGRMAPDGGGPTRPGALTWLADRSAGTMRFRLMGVLDIATEDCLSAAADEATQPAPANVVLDLAGVEFCDARGLSALLLFRRRLEDAGASVTFVYARPLVRRVFEIVGEGLLLVAPQNPA